MTGDRGVTLWIVIACVVIYSTKTGIGENNNGICKKNTSYLVTRENYYVVTREEWTWYSWPINVTHRVYNVTYVKKWELQDTCCKNYKEHNGTCKPQCSSPCRNGYCAEPNICKCNPGWNGHMCNVSLLCIINANSTSEMSEPSPLQSVVTINGNSSVEPIRPACHSKCQENFNSTDAVNTTRSPDGQIQYLIHINSTCNIAASHSSSFRKYITLMGALIGILLFAMIFYILYIVQKKRQRRVKIAHEFSDQPKSYVCADYIEENPIYS